MRRKKLFYKGRHREATVNAAIIRQALRPMTGEHDFALLEELLNQPERVLSTAVLR